MPRSTRQVPNFKDCRSQDVADLIRVLPKGLKYRSSKVWKFWRDVSFTVVNPTKESGLKKGQVFTLSLVRNP